MLSYKDGVSDHFQFEDGDAIIQNEVFDATAEQFTYLINSIHQILQNDFSKETSHLLSLLQELEAFIINDLYTSKSRKFCISIFEISSFPSFVLELISIEEPDLNILTYRFLDILTYLSDASIFIFLYENRIFDFCFGHLQNNSQSTYHILFSIGSLLPHSSKECLKMVVDNIPFITIFQNPHNLQISFLNSIIYLYTNIAKFAQIIPYPDFLIQYFQNFLNLPQPNMVVPKILNNLLDFYIQISTLPNLALIEPFLQKGGFYSSLIQKVFASKPLLDFHFLMLKLYQFYCNISKYLLHLCKNDDPKAYQFLEDLYSDFDSTDNVHFEKLKEMLEITNKEHFQKEESELSSDLEKILIFFKIFIKSNPHIMIQETFSELYPIIFNIIENSQFNCKLAAFKLLISLIKRETSENCTQIWTQYNLYQIIINALLTDQAENIQAALDLINIMVEKSYAGIQVILEAFNNVEFYSILDDIEESSSEKHIVEYCKQIREILQNCSDD